MPTTQAKKNTPDASQAHNDIQLIFKGGCATVPLSPDVVQCERCQATTAELEAIVFGGASFARGTATELGSAST